MSKEDKYMVIFCHKLGCDENSVELDNQIYCPKCGVIYLKSPLPAPAEDKGEELLPCPFCGGIGDIQFFHTNNIKKEYEPLFTVECKECFAMTFNYFDTKEKAISAWNRRTPPPVLEPLENRIKLLEYANRRANQVIGDIADECAKFGTPKTEVSDWDIEDLSAETHKVYCEAYEKRHGKPYHTNGDYSKLDEATKDYDRHFVRWAIKRFSRLSMKKDN